MIVKLKALFRQDLTKRLVKNTSFLLVSDGIGSVLRLISYALTARYLGPEAFGVLILIQTYVGVVDRLVNFQSWQAIIRYGAACVKEKREQDLNSLLRFCILLEAATALIGTVIVVALAPIVGLIFDWEKSVVVLSMIYSATILINITGTPVGVLRLFDRFDLLAWQRILSAVVKIIGVFIALWMNASMTTFVLVWMLTTVVEYTLFIAFGLHQLGKMPHLNIWSANLKEIKEKHPGLVGFVLSTNLQGAIRMSSRELDTLIVGAMLGVEAAGLYKIAKLFSLVLSKLAEPLYQSVYPELAMLWSDKQYKRFVKLIIYSGLFGGGSVTLIWVGFIFFGKWILLLTVGPDFVAAYPLLIWYMVAILISLYGLPLLPALLAMGKPHANLLFDAVSTIIYFTTLVLFIQWFGILGVSPAYIVYYVVWTILMIVYEVWIMRKKNIFDTA